MRLAALVLGASALLGPAAAAEQAAPRTFADWLTGAWIDPKVHSCDSVWIRIEAEADRMEVFTMTFENPVRASTNRILSVTPDGVARVWNEALGREQQIRYVGPNAHVLEKPNRAGGVTFVRCPEGPPPEFGPAAG